MSTIQNTTTATTQLNDGTQIKTTDFTKKTNLATENTDLSKPEFEYNRPAPTTLETSGATTGGSSIARNTGSTTYSGPSTTDHLKQKVSDIGHSISQAVTNASQQINHAVNDRHTTTGTTHSTQPSNTQFNTVTPGSEYNSNLQSSNIHQQPPVQQGGMGAKLSDMMSHVGAALHHGHPIHAVSNASTAAKVGECERVKHERGPIVDETAGTSHSSSLDNPNFNAAGQPYDNQSSAALTKPTTSTFNQSTAYSNPNQSSLGGSSTLGTSNYGTHSTSGGLSGHSDYTTGDKIRDMASHASAQLSHGNPMHAISDAPAAARIAEAEKLKHERGPINDSAPINDASNMSSMGSQSYGHNIPSGSGSGSLGGVTGISGQGGASSTMNTNTLNQQQRML